MQEFDVLKQNTIAARGKFIEYTAISVADGALRSGNAEITVRAGGTLVGRLMPGECLELEKAVDRWEITTEGYARVRIGMGRVDAANIRGVQIVESSVRTLRGTEFVLSVKSPTTAGVFNYCGFVNNSTDKIALVTNVPILTSAAIDVVSSFATIPVPPYTGDICMNRHAGVQFSAEIKGVSGSTVAVDPAEGEMLVSQEYRIYASVGSTRTFGDTANFAGMEQAIPPGTALLYRAATAGASLTARFFLRLMNYGPQ